MYNNRHTFIIIVHKFYKIQYIIIIYIYIYNIILLELCIHMLFIYIAKEIRLIESVLLSKHSFIYENLSTQFIVQKAFEKSTINKFYKMEIN